MKSDYGYARRELMSTSEGTVISLDVGRSGISLGPPARAITEISKPISAAHPIFQENQNPTREVCHAT